MVSALWAQWSEILSNPWQLGVTAYVIIGLCVVGFVSFSGMRLRNPPRGGILWDEKVCHGTLPWLISFSLGSSLTSKGGSAVRWKAARSLLA
jgi:hypothetical protein